MQHEAIAVASNGVTKSFRRILVVGPTGCGKSNLAATLADASGLPHIELDLLRYERGWQEVPVDEFIDRVTSIVERDSWIIDGNYSAVRELTWGRADLVVWLDYSLPVILWRLLHRTAHRLVTGEDVGNDNREKFRRVLGPRSIILWAIRSHAPLRKEYELTVAALKPSIPYVVRHRSPNETDAWLSKVEGTVGEFEDCHELVGGLSWATDGCKYGDRL